MFEVGFSELLLISVIALIVLGPERLPKLVAQVGRWVGKARAMARQFREQLETEVNLDELNRTTPKSTSSPQYPPPGEAAPNEPAPAPVDQGQADALASAHLTPEQQHAADTRHNDTPDYPYSAPSYEAHPEAGVYGGSSVPEPEVILSEHATSHDAMPDMTEVAPPPPSATAPATAPAEAHDAAAAQPARQHERA